MRPAYELTTSAMGTVVSIRVVGAAASEQSTRVSEAFAWFARVESACSRFDADSELRRLVQHIDEPVRVSDTLFEAIRFAVAVAEVSGGAFDPTVGATMESLGFDRSWRSGAPVSSGLPTDRAVSFRDVVLDDAERTVQLTRPMLLDLGAVAKGLAIDLAARELADLEHFAIDAGGDLYCAGLNESGEPWSIGVKHPRQADVLLARLRISNAAVCTSGDYERRAPVAHTSAGSMSDAATAGHIVDPRTGTSVDGITSVTVISPTAMVADAFATTAFVLGAQAGIDAGISFLEQQQVHGLMVTSALHSKQTRELHMFLEHAAAEVLHGA